MPLTRLYLTSVALAALSVPIAAALGAAGLVDHPRHPGLSCWGVSSAEPSCDISKITQISNSPPAASVHASTIVPPPAAWTVTAPKP